MFQAWQSVKVTNEDSSFHDQAGFVLRTEHEGDKAIVFVQMDTDSQAHSFSAEELQLL